MIALVASIIIGMPVDIPVERSHPAIVNTARDQRRNLAHAAQEIESCAAWA